MALLWREQTKDVDYQLRSAGSNLRLYSNGVLHSQYNPCRPLGGGVWDLLTLSALFNTKPLAQVLVLGVGGGAVIGQLKQLLPEVSIIGVDLDSNHLYIAKHYFGIKGSGITLVEADAKAWLQHYRGPRFDLIIDDLFGHTGGEPWRAFEVNNSWAALLIKHLASDGTLAINFESREHLKASALYRFKKHYPLFSRGYELSLPTYENAIGVFLPSKNSKQQLVDNILRCTGWSDVKRVGLLNFKLKSL